jgi:hypothetical protein
MGNCSSTSNCNPCGPDYAAINQLATKAGAYARQANTYSVDAQNAWLEFNALYLGAFAVAPTVDNEGDPLQTGALYWNTATNMLYAWNGVAWVVTNSFNEFTPFLATGTTTARNLVTRTADVYNVKDFGAIGDGIADDRASIQAALDAVGTSGSVYLPAGRYKIDAAIFIKRSNVSIIGDGVGVTEIVMGANGPYTAIDVRTSNANGGLGGNLFNITIENLSINGNKASRVAPGGNGIMLLCNTNHAIIDTRLINLMVFDCFNAGMLLEGRNNPPWIPGVSVPAEDGFRVERTIINGCVIRNNNGVGISQFKVNNSKITNCTLFSNGLENLTIDIRSNGCIVDGNTFFKHFGGTGNIGVDTGDACIISNNFIDNENDTTAPIGFRTGIALNSQIPLLQGNNDTVISDNIILRCSDNGIYAHDDTGIGGDKAGNGTIVGNVFAANGTDIRVEDGYGPLTIKSNKLQSINISDLQANDVRFGAGEVYFNSGLTSDQTIAFTVGDFSYKKINLDTIQGRFTSLSANEIQLPVGGVYQINGSVRIEDLTALNPDWISIAIRYTPDAGGPTIELALFDVDSTAPSFLDDILNLNISTTSLLDKGKVGLYIRANVGINGNATVEAGPVTKLTGAVLG